MGPSGHFTHVWIILDKYMQVLYLGRALRTKETLPDFLKWRRVTRHPLVFRGLTVSQRTPGFGVSHIQRYLYTYLYFYLSYTCIYLILCMNNYDYHIYLLFFLISGVNMSSTFIILCMAGFLTQWDCYRVQEHLKRNSDEGVMTFRNWRSYVVKPRQADLNWPS